MDNGIPVIKTSTRLLLSRLQGNKPHGNLPEPSQPCHTNRPEPSPNLASGTYTNTRRNSPPPEPSKTFCANPRQHTPEPSKIFRSLPELAPRTGPTPFYTGTLRNLPEPLQNLHQHTPELSGTFRNPSPEPTPAYAGTFRNLPELASRRNSPEPSGTRLRNLHQHTPELSGTFRNPLAEPTAAHHRTPEPSSGTCSCDPHRHTPELIWAEDPISLRCWGKKLRSLPSISY